LVARAALADFTQRRPVVASTDWTLRFTGVADRGAAPAVLTVGWVLRAAVVVEIDAWSRDRVLVGLRHRARAVPWWSDSYFTSAHDAVAMITTALEYAADEPLRTLLERAALTAGR
jgi:hypothetical protein